MNTKNTALKQGATTEDIQFHYDLSRSFYQHWLDRTMTYSSAMYEGDDDLETAQKRKLDHHIAQAEIGPGSRVLDIGCGWGSLMFRCVEQIPSSHCVGLTLSADQKESIDGAGSDRIEVLLKGWQALEEVHSFDAAVSVGAMEHFVGPGWSADDKIAVYRDFFKKVSRVLKPGGCLSLQTIVFDRMEESEFPPFITEKIFPGSMLPRQREILAASDRVLSLVNVRNDALDYARTCREWVQRIEAAKPELIAMVGADKTNEYVQYLRMSAAAFERQQFGLLRLKFRSYANA